MKGPKSDFSGLSFDINRNKSNKSNSSSSNSNNNTNTNTNTNNLVRVYFGGQTRPILSIISNQISCGSIPNTIKVYRCLKTNKNLLIKIENNRIYRLVGRDLICILINNIDNNWRLLHTYKDCKEDFIKVIYKSLVEFKNEYTN